MAGLRIMVGFRCSRSGYRFFRRLQEEACITTQIRGRGITVIESQATSRNQTTSISEM